MEPSILIVGAGAFGTSTAYHLALSYKDASQVSVVDQAASPPKPAASIDVNRIIRTDYPRPLYCNLANEAIHAWFWDLEIQRFFRRAGWLMLDEEGSDLSERILKVFKDRGSTQTEAVPLKELGERWDIMRDTDTHGFQSAYLNPDAGWCNAAGATASFMKAAEKRGVNRLTGRVTELLLDSSNGRITGVRTADGQHLTADKIVLCAGAWTSSLLSPVEDELDVPEKDRVERQAQAAARVSAYYKLSHEEVEKLSKSKMPIIVYGEKGEILPPSHENKTLKYNNSKTTVINTTTTESGRRISVPSPVDSQHLIPEQFKRETEAALTSKVLPEFSRGKQADHWRICWDALTPTEDWLLCKHPHPQLSNLYLALGGSFHSYKFMPNAGKYMLKVLNGESNGVEKDKAWAWKGDAELREAQKNTAPKRELKDLERESSSSVGQAKL